VRLKADVPFAFAVGKTALPAGEYRIDSLGTENRVLLIRSMDQNAQASTISNTGRSLEKSDQTKLVFHRYGDRYFLAEIWVQGYSSGHQLPQSKREKEFMAARRVPDKITVAALASSPR